MPACHCGILGIRPTHGRVSLAGAAPLAPSFDTAGGQCRAVSGCLRPCAPTCPSLRQPERQWCVRVYVCPSQCAAIHPQRAGWFARDPAVLRRAGSVLLDPSTRRPATLRRLLVAQDAFALAEPATVQALYGALSSKIAEVGGGRVASIMGLEL